MELEKQNTKIVKIIVLLLCMQCMLSLGLALNQVYEKPMLSSGDLRFAKARCEDHFTAASVDLKQMWSRNRFPDDNETHCYIKCLLSKLGLIDLIGRGLNVEIIGTIWRRFDAYIVQQCLGHFVLQEDLDDRCRTYYYKWIDLHVKCPIVAKLTFFEKGFEKNIGKFFVWSPRSKKRGISATEFCASLPQRDGENEVNSQTQYKYFLDCVFQYFHYFDAYGRLDESEILRSFDEANYTSSKNAEIVKKCTHRANMKYDGSRNCEIAFDLRNCLWRSTKDFSKVYIHRDRNSRQF